MFGEKNIIRIREQIKMTYLECKKVLCRCIHDVANLKAMRRNNGAVTSLDRVPGKALHPIFRNTTSLPKAFTFFSSGSHAWDDFELLNEATGQKSHLIQTLLHTICFTLESCLSFKKVKATICHYIIVIVYCTVSHFAVPLLLNIWIVSSFFYY